MSGDSSNKTMNNDIIDFFILKFYGISTRFGKLLIRFQWSETFIRLVG